MTGIELHCHTYHSDGKYSPAAVVEQAARAQIRVLAITDHDTLGGYREALALARANQIELIPAVEVTTRWEEANLPADDANVDVLGYFVNPDDDGFRAFEQSALDDLSARMDDTCRRLTADGYRVTLEDVLAQNPRYPGAVQLIFALIHNGHAPDWPGAFPIMAAAWEGAPPAWVTIQDAIAAIHHAGGAAVLAHPTIVRPQGQQMTEAWLARLVEAGLDGIEIYHRRLDAAARAHFLGLAETFGLLTSGGSDMHGWYRGMEELGTQPVTGEMVERLRSAAARKDGRGA